MSKSKDNENEFLKDITKITDEEINSIAEANDSLKDITKTTDEEINSITEANDSLMTTDLNQYDQTLEIMTQTLASIDTKMDVENLQLQKLDQLSEIKDQLNRLGDSSAVITGVAPESIVTKKNKNEIEEEIPKSSIGHNQQEISELLEKIQTLENKILTIENQSKNSNERFEKIENVVERFEDLENEIPNLFKNLFKKKEKTESYKTTIPKNTASIIEEAEESLENTNNGTLVLRNTLNETLINEDYNEELSKEYKKPKSNKFKYGLGIFLLLCAVITILFYFNKFQIIDLNFNQIIDLNFDKIKSSIFSLKNFILK